MVKHEQDEELRHDTSVAASMDVAAAELSVLDRFLPLWIIVSAGLGLALGQFHAVHAFIASTTVGGMNALVGVGLLAMMYPPLASVRWPLVGNAFTQDWRLLAVTSVQNWVVGPGLMFLLSVAFFRDEPGFLAGFSLVGCARCIGMVMIWISLAGGDLEYGAALIAVNSVLTLGLYALYASFLLATLPKTLGLSMQTELHITVGEIAANVGLYMGVPFALAILGWAVLVKAKGAQWYFESYAPRLDVVALLALLFTIVVLFASQSQRILSRIAPVLFAMVPFTIYFAVMFASTFLLSAKCGADYAQSATLAFTATSNNYELSLGVAVATFGLDSDPAMMSVVAALVEIPTMLLLVWLSLWAKRRYFTALGVSAIELQIKLVGDVEADVNDGDKSSYVEVKSPVTSRLNTVYALQQLKIEFKRLKRAVVAPEHWQLFFDSEQLHTDDNDKGGNTLASLTSAYIKLTLLKEELRRENCMLIDATREHKRFQQQLAKRIANDKIPHTHSSSVSLPKTTRRPPPPLLIKPFTIDECQKIATECYAEALDISHTNHFESSGVSVFGFRDERRVLDSGRVNFSTKKFFFGHMAVELSQAAWWLSYTRRIK